MSEQVAEIAATPTPAPVVDAAVAETKIDPAPIAAAVADAINKDKPLTPEARDAQITDELSAVWDKQQTNGVEKGPDGKFVSAKKEQAVQPQEAKPEPAKPAIGVPASWTAEAKAY